MKSWMDHLKRKLTLKPDSNFDREFWRKFDEEFKSKKSFFGFDHKVWITAVLLLAISTPIYLKTVQKNTLDTQMVVLIENEELLNDLELVETLDEDLMLASSEDWSMLLE